MSLPLKLALSPLWLVQAVATRRRAPMLPEAEGARSGRIGGKGPVLRLLIAGDSSAAGVGVAHQEQALAGCLTRALHQRTRRALQWTLVAHSGLTTRQVHALLQDRAAGAALRADVALVVTGVNDVIEQVGAQRAVAHRAALADWLLEHTGVRHVVFAPLPPLQRFPLLPQPLKRIMGDDAHQHDLALDRWAATRSDVSHACFEVSLDRESMAADGFHPGGPVYRACGEALAAHIAALQLELRK